jgi:hypothetical protein
MYHFESAEKLGEVKLHLITADLDVALTFAQIALQTQDRQKAIHNRQNARKAYDAVLRYMGSASLSRFDRENMMRKLSSLKSALLSLGESF